MDGTLACPPGEAKASPFAHPLNPRFSLAGVASKANRPRCFGAGWNCWKKPLTACLPKVGTGFGTKTCAKTKG